MHDGVGERLVNMGIAEAFAGAMRALVAIDAPLRRRIADARD